MIILRSAFSINKFKMVTFFPESLISKAWKCKISIVFHVFYNNIWFWWTASLKTTRNKYGDIVFTEVQDVNELIKKNCLVILRGFQINRDWNWQYVVEPNKFYRNNARITRERPVEQSRATFWGEFEAIWSAKRLNTLYIHVELHGEFIKSIHFMIEQIVLAEYCFDTIKYCYRPHQNNLKNKFCGGKKYFELLAIFM